LNLMKELDHFYFEKEEPIKGCLLALRTIITDYNSNLIEDWKYRSPHFTFNNKNFCYLWVDPKTKFPYIGIIQGLKIEHPKLVKGNRTFVKVLPIDPEKDIPIDIIHEVLKMAIVLYN